MNSPRLNIAARACANSVPANLLAVIRDLADFVLEVDGPVEFNRAIGLILKCIWDDMMDESDRRSAKYNWAWHVFSHGDWMFLCPTPESQDSRTHIEVMARMLFQSARSEVASRGGSSDMRNRFILGSGECLGLIYGLVQLTWARFLIGHEHEVWKEALDWVENELRQQGDER